MSAIASDLEVEPDWPPGLTRPPRGDELPCDDGEPLETERHREQMFLLIDTLRAHWADRDDFYVGGNMFLYFSSSQAKNNDFRGPDVFVVKGTHKHERKSWVVWEEDGLLPSVIVEITSDTTAHIDRGDKLRVYGRVLNIPEYYIYDPFSHELDGHRNGGNGFSPIARNQSDRLPSNRLELELGLWQGNFADINTTWLRWFTTAGVLLPTEAERARAEEGLAQAATRRAEQATQLAEQETQRANEAERGRDEATQQVADLAAKLAAYERQFARLGVAEPGPND